MRLWGASRSRHWCGAGGRSHARLPAQVRARDRRIHHACCPRGEPGSPESGAMSCIGGERCQSESRCCGRSWFFSPRCRPAADLRPTARARAPPGDALRRAPRTVWPRQREAHGSGVDERRPKGSRVTRRRCRSMRGPATGVGGIASMAGHSWVAPDSGVDLPRACETETPPGRPWPGRPARGETAALGRRLAERLRH